MRIGAQILVHAPDGKLGQLVTQAAAIAVRSLQESDAARHDLTVLVVEHGCRHPDYFRWRDISHAQVCSLPTGLNFSQARNWGYKTFGLENFNLFLEFDVDNVFPTLWFEPLRAFLQENPKVGLLSPGAVMADKWEPCNIPVVQVDYEAMHYSDILWRVNKAAHICRWAYRGKVGSVRYPPVLKRTHCLQEMGLYDEGFVGGGWEDWDEVMRCHAAGWEVRTCLDSFAFHWGAWQRVMQGGWSGRDDSVDELNNRAYFFSKWPDGEPVRQEYIEAWNQLYGLP